MVFPLVVISSAVALLIGADDDQLLLFILIEIGNDIFGIGLLQQFLGLELLEFVDRQGLEGLEIVRVGVVHPPAHRQLHDAVSVHIGIGNAVNGSAAALDNRGLLIALPLDPEDVDLQRLFLRALAEKSHSLLCAVPVQIHQLHRLDIAAGQRGSIFRAVTEDGVDLIFQLRVFLRQLRQTVQVLHPGVEKTACQQETQAENQRQTQQFLPTHRQRNPSFPGAFPLGRTFTGT